MTDSNTQIEIVDVITFDEADKKALVERLKKQAMNLGWKSPFFLPSIARIVFVPTLTMPTAAVDLRGNIYFNPNFAARKKDSELQFVIAHELMHLLMLHHDRRGLREPLRWNIANDMIINLTLKKVSEAIGAGTFTVPSDAILAEDSQADLTSEQLYHEINEPSDAMRQAFTNNTISVGQGCGPMPGTDLPQDEVDALQRQWREVVAQSQMSGRSAGDTAGNLLADLLDVPPAKVRWSEVLRSALYRAVAEAGRDDVSWSRRSRRSGGGIILPGGVTYRCRAAVVIDTSGSMSDDNLQRAVAETAAIVDNCRVPVFLVVHDVEVQAAVWLRPGSKAIVQARVKTQLKGRGGTCFEAAYDRVEAEPGRFNAMIHLTDAGVGGWPARPASVRRLVVALIGAEEAPNAPADARIIAVEL